MDADEERALEELDVVLHSFYTESRKKGLGVQPRKGDVFICWHGEGRLPQQSHPRAPDPMGCKGVSWTIMMI